MGSSERNRNSFADIAKLLSDFFRELDVVPSDVVAGLVLLRKFQKIERQSIVRQVYVQHIIHIEYYLNQAYRYREKMVPMSS